MAAGKATFFANGRLPRGGRSDFLVSDGRFVRIGADLPRPNDAEIVDLYA